MVLAIETTQRRGGVAVQDAAGRRHIELFPEARRHDDRLMPAIAELFARAELAPPDLAGVAVSIGPGGFSGLRIAVATARTLALSTPTWLVGVASAEVVAAGTPGLPASGRILVALGSKGERAWVETLQRSGPTTPWRRDAAVARRGTASDFDVASADALVGDDHLPPAMRDAATAAGRPVVPPVFDPAACLDAGLAQFADVGPTPPAELLPIYPGPPEAVAIWNERHGGDPSSDTPVPAR